MWQLSSKNRNIILYGPPGTGKTWLAQHFAVFYLLYQNQSPQAADEYWQALQKGDTEKVLDFRGQLDQYLRIVTFHQSFAYEEFVEGLKPLPSEDEKGSIKYEVVPGIFRKICEQAVNDWQDHKEHPPLYFLLIDEINRANIAKVFGELITLIEEDKQLGQINQLNLNLPYSGSEFGIPPNLIILGTMNSADRSIALLDLALRRRFKFLEVTPNSGLLGRVGEIDLQLLLDQLNQRITALLDKDHQIGHSYFLKVIDLDDLRLVWYQDIVPLVEEYFYGDFERQHAVLGDFITKVEISKSIQNKMGDLYDPDSPASQVAQLEGDEFTEAIKVLCEED